MLEARDVTFSISGRELLSGVSARFEPGLLHLVIGPNGAGKSTLVKLLARLTRPTAGSIFYESRDIATTDEATLAKRRAVLSQAIEVAFPLSVREVVMMGRYPHFGGRPGPTDEVLVDELMDFVDVTGFATRNYQTLSGGERQRVNFARVLGQVWPSERAASDFPACRYLFLDEPLTFLDVHHQIDLMKKVRDFAASADAVTIGVVHDLNLAARFADRLYTIRDGKIVASGTPQEVLNAELIKDVFQVDPQFVDTAEGVHIIFG